MRPHPINLGNNAASITEGTPTFTSGIPKTAASDAILMSQAAASSMPAPRLKPFTLAIVGTFIFRIRTNNSCRQVIKSRDVFSFNSLSSFISAPPTKDFDPAPVKTSPRNSLSSATS